MVKMEPIFGPIHSRRLGLSLGLNLLPKEGKLCNFDCIYCECGWNKDGKLLKNIFPTIVEIREGLQKKMQELLQRQIKIDSITFAGTGEPTLHPDFPIIVKDVLNLRDEYCPTAKVSVLSNATMLGRKEVLEALKKVDNPIMKLDAPTDELLKYVNKPLGSCSVEKLVRDLQGFHGDFILQTMFFKSKDFDSCEPVYLSSWLDIVRRLAPREIMVYTLDRKTAMEEGLFKCNATQMREAVEPLIREGFKVMISE